VVKDGEANLIIARETDEDLLRFDRLPNRLTATSDTATSDTATSSANN